MGSVLRLGSLAPTLYMLRHGGASEDMLTGKRSVEAIKRRGRWRSDTSLRRYTKETRLLKELSKMAPSLIQFGSFIETHLSECFNLERHIPVETLRL